MKFVFVFVFAMVCASFVFAGSNPAFDNMKSLAGDWKGAGPDGKPFTVSFQVISGGSVVLERMNEEQMVTTYYLNGDQLMMTHYCMANNQPRMKAAAMNGKELAFQFVDATNLASENAGHMHNMTLTFEDANHIQESWEWSENGKTEPHAFKLERVK